MCIKVIILIAFLLMELTVVNGGVLRRKKRFVLQPNNRDLPTTTVFPFAIPTTYPVPTIPNRITGSAPSSQMTYPQQVFGAHSMVGMVAGSGYVPGSIPIAAVLNSVPINCPIKRDASSRRVLLDDDLMREIYHALIGNHDKGGAARSTVNRIDNALNTINPAKSSQKRINSTNLLRDITLFKDWFESTRQYLSANSSKQEKTSTSGRKMHDPKTLDGMLQKLNITRYELELLLGLQNDLGDVIRYIQRRDLRRHKRNADGSVSRTEYCHPRGSSTGDGFLHMCSACALTTQFAEDKFPRVISEVDCDASDCDCFTVKGTPHGRCQTVNRPMKMLRKRVGMCRLMVFKGEHLILDDWEIYDQSTRVGCECEFNKNSLYAMFIPSGP